MLRQAPNIILVGEIRDLEVAEVAIQAALTGHLVFSTLHTNDAPGAITRLIDMGVKPFLVAVVDPGGHGPAADPRALPQVQAARPRAGRDVAASWPASPPDDLKDKHALQAARLRLLHRHRLPRAHRHLRDDADEQRDARRSRSSAPPTNKIRKAALASGMKTPAGRTAA